MEGCLYWKYKNGVTQIAGLKIEGIVKWRGLKLQGPLYILTWRWLRKKVVNNVHSSLACEMWTICQILGCGFQESGVPVAPGSPPLSISRTARLTGTEWLHSLTCPGYEIRHSVPRQPRASSCRLQAVQSYTYAVVYHVGWWLVWQTSTLWQNNPRCIYKTTGSQFLENGQVFKFRLKTSPEQCDWLSIWL